jgi:hypothetical protein
MLRLLWAALLPVLSLGKTRQEKLEDFFHPLADDTYYRRDIWSGVASDYREGLRADLDAAIEYTVSANPNLTKQVRKSLSDRDQVILRWYTRETGLFKPLNKALRSHNAFAVGPQYELDDATLDLRDCLQNAIHRKDFANYGTVHRRLRTKGKYGDGSLREGDIIEHNDFLSTNMKKKGDNYRWNDPIKQYGKFKVVIHNAQGCKLGNLSRFKREEDEILLPCNSRFRVKKIKDSYIELDMLSPGRRFPEPEWKEESTSIMAWLGVGALAVVGLLAFNYWPMILEELGYWDY